jgi:hypothetical protein
MTKNDSGRANRVAPDGSLHAVAARGLLWGNRGPLLDERGELVRHSRGRGWVCCLLDFHDRRREQWRPGRLTELYFLDEATALAAGHRPCGECRRADHRRFRLAWSRVFPEDRSSLDVDRRLHAARLATPGEHRTYDAFVESLPDGTMIEHDSRSWLLRGSQVLAWSFDGYRDVLPRTVLPAVVRVRTPEPTVAALLAGFVSGVHPSATAAR